MIVDSSSDSNSWKNVTLQCLRVDQQVPLASQASSPEPLMLQIHNIIVSRSIDVIPTKIVSHKVYDAAVDSDLGNSALLNIVCCKMEVSLKVICLVKKCLPYAVGKQSSIPLINLGRK